MSWSNVAWLSGGLLLGYWCSMSWAYVVAWRGLRREHTIRNAAQMAKVKHREKLAEMELGWRERDERRKAKLHEEEMRMRTLLSRIITVTPDRVGDVICFQTSMPERLLYEVTHPLDERDYIHYVAERVAHLVQQEICMLNGKRLHEMRMKPGLEVYGLRREW